MAENLILPVTLSGRKISVPPSVLRKRFGRYRLCETAFLDAENAERIARRILRGAVDTVLLDVPQPVCAALLAVCREMGVTVCEVQDGGLKMLCGGVQRAFGARLCKRLIDIAGSLVGLLFAGFVFLAAAPMICRKSPGPVFFSQERVGLNGRRFRLWKFRTMYVGAENRKAELMAQNKMQGCLFKVDNDPRVIPGVGRLLRRTGMDELPQMWNVLRGEMSLVGTRPPTLDEFERYEYRHKSRLAAKPGITGLWQSCGRRRETDFEKVVALDNAYISGWNLALDFKILLKTAFVVLFDHGSV